MKLAHALNNCENIIQLFNGTPKIQKRLLSPEYIVLALLDL
jgi:hypothetical protein